MSCGNNVGGAFNNNIGFILVLFILLVIISCSCGFFGGGYGGNVGGVGAGPYGKGY
ncbi:hypothetical protein KP806_22250 [Paenibacillus sp. N4]|uniref:hypothetical protein n=1 Tax=Paenibacillus vietnamensis TaxID=2590547 RepID=UPI001CD117FA|nr:hypothetical protein [Paenibacillus vietnamensis]MCA0757789.1 hypothetical protein [Paenibacillus vietnamensis]